MPYPQKVYQDGRSQVVQLFIYCFNNQKTYTTYDGDPSEGAQVSESRNSDNVLIGSVTFGDARKGTINCQYELIGDELPNSPNQLYPGYIISFRQRFYVVGPMKVPITKNGIIKFSFEATELQNPFFPGLLSLLGQQLKVTAATADLPDTADGAASNILPGAAVAYTLESYAVEGAAAPAGFSIHASTGVITIANTVTAGIYDVRAVATETITLPEGGTVTRTGWGRLTFAVTA
jgi:hypothetical protein